MTETTEQALPLYEGMFLFSLTAIEGNPDAAREHLEEILERAGAEVEALYRWDERKLAYPIGGEKRGLYLRCLFRVKQTQIANIERDVNLSELLMRAMMLKAEHIGDIEMQQHKEKATFDASGETPPQASDTNEADTDEQPATQSAEASSTETQNNETQSQE